MSTMTQTTVQVYQLFIRATPEQIWEAIVDPELTSKYFYGSRITITPRRPRLDEPRRLGVLGRLRGHRVGPAAQARPRLAVGVRPRARG